MHEEDAFLQMSVFVHLDFLEPIVLVITVSMLQIRTHLYAVATASVSIATCAIVATAFLGHGVMCSLARKYFPLMRERAMAMEHVQESKNARATMDMQE